MNKDFIIPTQIEIVNILKRHKLIKFKEYVKFYFLVGSFCTANHHKESDVDILLEVVPREGFMASDLENDYRKGLINHFISKNIQGKCDEVHPQWQGRRIDLYITYDASLENRPKLLLEKIPLIIKKSRKLHP